MPPPHTVHLLYKQYYAFSDIVMPCVMFPTIHNNNTSPNMPKSKSSISASNYLKSKYLKKGATSITGSGWDTRGQTSNKV